MPASTGDKITDVRNAARPVTTTVSSGRSAGGATLACSSLTGWPTASKVHFVTYKIDSNSNPVAGTQLDCQGIVSGNNINSFSVIDGSDTGNAVGDIVEMLPTAAYGQDLADALTASHNRDGTPKSGVIYPASTFTTPTLNIPVISDFTSANHTHATTAQGGAISNVLMSNPYKFSVYRNAAYNTAATLATKFPFDTKSFDTGTNFDVATNNRFVAPINGFYQFNSTIVLNVATTTRYFIYLAKNGAEIRRSADIQGTNAFAASVSGMVSLNTSDYIEVYYYAQTAVAILTGVGTSFDGFLVSAT